MKTNSMTRFLRLALVAFTLPLVGLADTTPIPFTVKITPRAGGVTAFSFLNESTEPITGLLIEKDSTSSGSTKFAKLMDNCLSSGLVETPLYVGRSDGAGAVREVYSSSAFRSVIYFNGTSALDYLTSWAENTWVSNQPPATIDHQLISRSRIKTGTFQTPQNTLGDGQIQRLHAYVTIPATGDYRFKMTSDDSAVMTYEKIEATNSAAHVLSTHVVTRDGWSPWDTFLQFSPSQTFNKGDVVYMAVWAYDYGGPDHIRIGWQYTVGTTTVDEVIPVRYLSSKGSLGWPDLNSDPVGVSEESSCVRIKEIATLLWGGTYNLSTIFTDTSKNAATELWNLSQGWMATKITVFGAYGNQGTLTLGTTQSTEIEQQYEFKTTDRPLKLSVQSVDDSGNIMASINQFSVEIIDPTLGENGGILVTTNNPPFATYSHLFLRKGMQVKVSVPNAVYFNKNSQFMYVSGNDGTTQSNAYERYVATGLSINNSAPTGDATEYTAEMQQDLTVKIRWQHQFALRVKQDFTLTASRSKTEQGTSWTGPLTSGASGSPTHDATSIHWIDAGADVVDQIDGSIADTTHAGMALDIRYVPFSYFAEGSALGVNWSPTATELTNLFTVGQQPPSRQQVNAFAMKTWANITYRWRVQYGVRVSSLLGTGGGNLSRVYSGTNAVLVGAIDGVYWFNEETPVYVLAQANVVNGNALSQALSGWTLGDGYYFTLSGGTVDPQSGELGDGTTIYKASDGSPVARWLKNKVADGLTLRGLEIPSLARPVNVSWQFGSAVYTDPSVPIGEYVFQGTESTLPSAVLQRIQTVAPTSSSDPSALVWDANAGHLYPIKPGEYTATWEVSGYSINVKLVAAWPSTPQYRHIAGTPEVQLTPDASGNFVFKQVAYTENSAVATDTSLFTAEAAGWSTLLFSEIKQIGRGEPKAYVRIRTVKTETLATSLALNPTRDVIIGQTIRDSLDLANMGTGYLVYLDGVRYNATIYNRDALAGLRSTSVYDMTKLRSLAAEKAVTHPEVLPGPVIPVNAHPGAQDLNRITIIWYDDPATTDGILWPYAARKYTARWPVNTAEGLGRIVIASEFGSESVGSNGLDQVIAVATNGNAAVMTYAPSRFSDLKVYAQNSASLPGYNPNEEHALIAPSLRYAQVSPRPNAVYALRNNDLNVTTGTGYTSDPYVLVQFYDTLLQEYGMRVYKVQKEDVTISGYRFAVQSLITNTQARVATVVLSATGAQLTAEPHKLIEAGEPVTAFYPLGVVEGAVPSPETFGQNIKGQLTFWKDHKSSRWSVSGGTSAWFTVSAFYPLQGDFWWPTNNAAALKTGDRLPFLPSALTRLAPTNDLPTKILYKSDWPAIAPVLKAGETLTYSGGEYRQDHSTIVVDGKTVTTPGLPAVLGFAVANVVFDAINPSGDATLSTTRWTLRAAQVLETRSVAFAVTDFPAALKPAAGKSRTQNGKYVFSDLPASLQKRMTYDPISGYLELKGFVNEKSNTDSTLTASPGAVYVLEPNILTVNERDELISLDDEDNSLWDKAVEALYQLSRNPSGLVAATYGNGAYSVGLQPKVKRDMFGSPITYLDASGVLRTSVDSNQCEAATVMGPGVALIPNGTFLDPAQTDYPEVSWVTLAENNDSSMGGSPVALHIVKVDRRERYRGSIKTVLSANVFDENVVLRHSGDFGANADDLVYEWWYRPDDGSLDMPPPFTTDANSAGDWKLFPDLSGKNGLGRNEVLLKGDPNAPEALLADSWWFVRYRHKNDKTSGTNWAVKQTDNSAKVNFEWAGAGNSDPFHDYDLNGVMDYKPQLSMGWIKRVLDAVNPYEARISDFSGDSPITTSSMLQQFGARYEGAVALNPDKDVVENVGLIELYQTILNRASDLSINLTTPISTPAIANALQLASTRLSDFYMLLGNEAYVDAKDPAIGYGSSSVEYGAAAPSVFAFQNQVSSLLEEELDLLRGQDDSMARPVYNRLFWNFTKGEGEAAYAMNYNISDINMDGFIDEDDAMMLYPQGHGDAWGHYLTALTQQYNLLRHPYFNWVSRSEFYNLNDVVMKVDFLDERKFAQIAAQKAQTGAEIVSDTYRENYVEDETAQWQGYTDVNKDRAWGVQDWARRAGQGAYFDWITANALLPSVHPNTTLTGIQKVDRQENADIRVISANLNQIQTTLDNANSGLTPIGVSAKAVPFDINPQSWDDTLYGRTHFEQIYDRAVAALKNAKTAWDVANQAQNRLRAIANTEQEFRNDVYQQNLTYRNELIELFGRPYPGTIGSGKFYEDGYVGPDLAYYMYVAENSTDSDAMPQPSSSAVVFDANGNLSGGNLKTILDQNQLLNGSAFKIDASSLLNQVSMLFGSFGDSGSGAAKAADGAYDTSSVDLSDPDNESLTDINFKLPITASTYSMVAPDDWGERPAVGELQVIIADMLQQQVAIADTISSYESMWLDFYRAMNLMEISRELDDKIAKRNQDLMISKSVINTVIIALKTTLEILEETEQTVTGTFSGIAEAIPNNTPTLGLANSLGDALAPVRGTLKASSVAVTAGLGGVGVAAKILESFNEVLWDITEAGVELANADDEREKSYAEMIAGIDDMLGDEGGLRVTMFAQAQQLNSLAEQYRSTLSKGSLIIDEREAFNRRVSAMVQQNRYQDMTFRVQRNHALQNYNRLLDIAARYVYLAAKAYDYETNFGADDPGSPSALFAEIVQARTLGLVDDDDVPQIGDGLAGILAHLETNYEALKGQLGLTNPQVETGKLSLRSEKFRIFPSGYTPSGDTTGWSGQADASQNWKDVLSKARVKNLWDVPEYRYLARPFASDVNADGTRAVEPGIVLRFATDITAGKNAFGHPLAGGDHAYDSSVYANRIRSVGIWFSDYLSADVLSDLSAAPRVYLMPTGADVMSIPNASSPDQVRVWNVLDQVIPVPLPGIESMLPYSNFVPLLDSLDGRIGLQRRYSSFRAYHDSGSAVNTDELVSDSRLVGRSVWNTGWTLIIPGRTLNADPDEGLDRFINQVSDIKLVFETYGFSGN